MDVYFYCSYEHSQRGFFLTRLQDGQLVPADWMGGDCPPDVVKDFFSYERFRILWRDFSEEAESLLFPAPTHGMFGIRGLEGQMSDRAAIVNLALVAQAHEREYLKELALRILGDFDGFVKQLFSCLSIGGKWGYQLDAEAFLQWQKEMDICGAVDGNETDGLADPANRQFRASGGSDWIWCVPEDDPAGELLRSLQKPDGLVKTERDLLHFAVCTTYWEAAMASMGRKWVWKLRPKCVLDAEQFEREFLGRGPLFTTVQKRAQVQEIMKSVSGDNSSPDEK